MRAISSSTGRLQPSSDARTSASASPPCSSDAGWERINEALVETDFQISETARWLGMHRGALARKLEKRLIKQERRSL